METIWICRRIPPPFHPDIVSVSHDFCVMGPVHSNFLDDGYWMHSNDYQADQLGVQPCLGPSSHHRREKPIPDKPRLIISRVMNCYFLCRTFTILEKLFPNQSFLPLCVCAPLPQSSISPESQASPQIKDLIWEYVYIKWGEGGSS